MARKCATSIRGSPFWVLFQPIMAFTLHYDQIIEQHADLVTLVHMCIHQSSITVCSYVPLHQKWNWRFSSLHEWCLYRQRCNGILHNWRLPHKLATYIYKLCKQPVTPADGGIFFSARKSSSMALSSAGPGPQLLWIFFKLFTCHSNICIYIYSLTSDTIYCIA